MERRYLHPASQAALANRGYCPRWHSQSSSHALVSLNSRLDVPERRQLVPPAIHVSELLAVIRDIVDGEGRFSSLAVVLVKSEVGKYRVCRLSDPLSRLRPLKSDLSGESALVLLAGTLGPGTPFVAGIDQLDAARVASTEEYVSLDSALPVFVDILMGGTSWGQPSGTIDGVDILGLSNRTTPARTIWQRIRSLFESGH